MFGKVIEKRAGRKEEGEYKLCRVCVQVSEKEKEVIQALAKEKGMNVSDYVRQVAIYEAINNFVKFND